MARVRRKITPPPADPVPPRSQGYTRVTTVDAQGRRLERNGTVASIASPEKQCGARKRNGESCMAPAMSNGRCRVHGGRTPKGELHGAYKHGRYSQALPERLAERYWESLQDPDLLTLKHEITLIDERTKDVLAGLSSEETGRLWRKTKDLVAELSTRAHTERDRDRIIAQLVQLTETGYKEWESWSEVQGLTESRRKLVDSERSRLKDMNQMVTAEQATLLLHQILGIIRQRVTDRDTLIGISYDLTQLAVVESSRGGASGQPFKLLTTGETPSLGDPPVEGVA